jgi:hypothetical protein
VYGRAVTYPGETTRKTEGKRTLTLMKIKRAKAKGRKKGSKKRGETEMEKRGGGGQKQMKLLRSN